MISQSKGRYEDHKRWKLFPSRGLAFHVVTLEKNWQFLQKKKNCSISL